MSGDEISLCFRGYFQALAIPAIDHTQLDIELISERTGKPLGRPWLSFAIDAYSRWVVAIYLTYDPPSYHTVMMVVRDMVRRFARLPECGAMRWDGGGLGRN